jgi:hypothetical protein
MRKLIIATTAHAMITGLKRQRLLRQPHQHPQIARPRAVGSERGNNASSLDGSNAASGSYSGANAARLRTH